MSERYPEVEAMKRLLHTRLKKRRFDGGQHYQLDMRLDGLRGGRIAVRNPDHAGWPEKGEAARTKAEALRWIDAYVDRLGLGWCRGQVLLRTVKEHGEAYLEHVGKTKGPDSSAFLNHKNYLRNHVYPRLGEQRLRSLTHQQVQELVDGMRTLKGKFAGDSLRWGTVAALNNVWRRAFAGSPVPWSGKVTVRGVDANRARRERAKAGIRLSEAQRGYTPAELRWILVTAFAVDLVGARNPKKTRGVDNHADLIAFLIHHFVRIEEGSFLRRKDVDLEFNCVLIAGTKNTASEERLGLTQKVYEPWRDRLLDSVSDPEGFLLPTARGGTSPAVGTLKDKVLHVLKVSGLKRKGELSHVFRSSHTSIAVGPLSAEEIAAFSGRKIPGDDQLSTHYLRWRSFVASLPREKFEYFPDLGKPEELEQEARRALRDGRLDPAEIRRLKPRRGGHHG